MAVDAECDLRCPFRVSCPLLWSGLAGSALGGAGAGASTSAMMGGDAGLGALAGFASGAAGYLTGSLGIASGAIAGGVSSVIQGGKFGDGAIDGVIHSAGQTLGGILAPMKALGKHDLQKGDVVYLKPENFLTALISFIDGGVFSHTGIYLGDGEMAHSTLNGGSGIVDVVGYKDRGAYIDKRFRGNKKITKIAAQLANRSIGYGFLPGQKVCSTFNAAVFNQAGYQGWYGIGPNSQSSYQQFEIMRSYGY